MTYSVTENINQAWGYFFFGNVIKPPNFPIPFVGKVPYIFESIRTSGSDIISMGKGHVNAPSLTSPGGFYVYSPVSLSNVKVEILIRADGYWK